MLTIPSTVQNLFKADGVRKNFRVHFPNGEYADITNDNVVSESVKFTESLCSQNVFKFGLAEASVLEFETVGIGNMYGMTIEASCEIDCSSLSAADKATIAAGTWDGTWDGGNSVFSVPYGVFRVESCPRNHGAMTHRQVIAYTLKEHDYENFPNLSSLSVFPKLLISTEAFIARSTGTAVFHDSMTFGTNMYTAGSLYNSSGVGITVSVSIKKNGVSKQARLARWCRVYDVGTALNTDHWTPSFAEASDVTYDYEKHFAFGKRVAKAITDAGLDLTYNSKQQKVYTDNESALLANFPYYFYPCMYYMYRRFADDNNYTDIRTAPKVKLGELIPIVTLGNSPIFPGAISSLSAFKADATDVEIRAAYIVACADLSEETEFDFGVSLTGIAANIPDFSFNASFPTSTPTINRYGLTSYDTMLTVNPAGAGENIELYNLDGNLTRQTYSYLGAFSYLKMIDGILELSARFMKDKRSGGFELMRLSAVSPLSILPESYSDCWWDEYDISPIGSVAVTYLDADNQETEAEVQIGGGSSVYDMTENELLKTLSLTSQDAAAALINTNFAPYTGDVAFTPIDLNMQGWPWIEAGDALEITAEDGTVVETYALRIEMSGVQHLTAVITSEGGEIIEGVT